jgi:hypothetical protein
MGIPLASNRCLLTHPSDENLEDYAFHRLPEALVAHFEEHLLLCPSCQDALREIDQFVAALKALPRPMGGATRPVGRRDVRTSLGPILAIVILVLVVLWNHPQEASTPAAVRLSSLRDMSPPSSAPAGKALRLSFDLPDLLPQKDYRVEIVNAAGLPVWQGTASEIDGRLVATLSKPLGNGVYWVRLYGANSKLLREFGLSAE